MSSTVITAIGIYMYLHVSIAFTIGTVISDKGKQTLVGKSIRKYTNLFKNILHKTFDKVNECFLMIKNTKELQFSSRTAANLSSLLSS